MTILRRAAPTRWLYPAILLLLFMEKSSALEIAGYGGSASWTQIGFWTRTTEDKAGAPGGILSFSQDGSRLLMGGQARVGIHVMTSPCTNGNPVRAPIHRSVIFSQNLAAESSTARLFQAMATWLRSATATTTPGQNRFGPPACSTTQAALGNRSVPISSGL